VRLAQKQVLFPRLLAVLIMSAESKGWELRLGEGYIDPERVREALKAILEREPTQVELREVYGHKLGGCHPLKLAQDMNLFIRGRWIKGDHPVWHEIGALWLSLHPLCRWGGDYGDYNHFSLKHGRRA